MMAQNVEIVFLQLDTFLLNGRPSRMRFSELSEWGNRRNSNEIILASSQGEKIDEIERCFRWNLRIFVGNRIHVLGRLHPAYV